MANQETIKLAAVRAMIVLCPSYGAAWLTDKMVYVVPTLAAASFFAASLSSRDDGISRNVDEGDSDDGPDGEFDGETGFLDE